MLKRIFRILLWTIGILFLLMVGLVWYVRIVAQTEPPEAVVIAHANYTPGELKEVDSGLWKVDNSWFRKSESGLYELYVDGDPIQRGTKIGLLTKDLIRSQEKVFNDQIETLIPSRSYREVLKYFVGWFNRDIDDYVDEEFKAEIYGVSRASSSHYDYIASPYQRILNYHGAHDIGHALQNMALVGCTSFATWGDQSADSSLIIGRNFDFYVGDEFAENKIVAFYKPDKGHPFVMLTFGGMTGVLSGMNTQGLTVTINAAKSDIPSAAATPVSLVAREILQYASTIDEAYAIASRYKMFVAESFLIGSAKDGKAALIEKNTEDTDLFQAEGNYIISTNHFQGKKLGETQLNKEHMETSASPYRYQRVKELLLDGEKNSIGKTVSILRNQKGLQNADIGLGNEKAINQLIAHHGIVFQPERNLVWISTSPYQLGKFVCYDLNKIFNLSPEKNIEVYEADRTIAADSFMLTSEFKKFMEVERYRFPFNKRDDLDPEAVMAANPEGYHAYMFAGDYYYQHEDYGKAVACYVGARTKEIATKAERDHIEKYMLKAGKKIE